MAAPYSANPTRRLTMDPSLTTPSNSCPLTQSSHKLKSLKRTASSPAGPTRASKLVAPSLPPKFAPSAPNAQLTDFIRCAILNLTIDPQFLHDNPVGFPCFPISPLATSNSPAEDEVLSDRFFYYSATKCEKAGLGLGGHVPLNGGFFLQLYTGNSELQNDEDGGSEGEESNEKEKDSRKVNLYTVGIDACLWDEDMRNSVEKYEDLKLYGERNQRSVSDHVVLEFSFRMRDADMKEKGNDKWKKIVWFLRNIVARGFTSKGVLDSGNTVLEVDIDGFGTVGISSITREGIRESLGFPKSQVEVKAGKKHEEMVEEDVVMGGV